MVKSVLYQTLYKANLSKNSSKGDVSFNFIYLFFYFCLKENLIKIVLENKKKKMWNIKKGYKSDCDFPKPKKKGFKVVFSDWMKKGY